THRGEQIRTRVLLVRMRQARRALGGQVLQERSAEGAADRFEGRRSVAVALMAAHAASPFELALPCAEGRWMALLGGHRQPGGERLARWRVEGVARPCLARETAPVAMLQRDIGWHRGAEAGMALGTAFLAEQRRSGGALVPHIQTADNGLD